VSTGTEYPIAQGASGKVLLAFSKSHSQLHDQVRERLWAASYGERDPDTASVSAPVFGVTGELQGALAVSGPRQRLAPAEAMQAACQQVLAFASEATLALGGDVSRYVRALSQVHVGDFVLPERG
jgi:DNA-binding IclR family transcriptional regulator